MKTVASVVSKRVKEILNQKGMSVYRLQKITAIPQGSIQSVMRADNNGVNLKTVLLLTRGMGISAKEFFDSPLFEDEELDID